MDFIIDLVITLFFEGSVEVTNRIKMPRIVRYIFVVVVTGLLVLLAFAFMMLSKYFKKEMMIIGLVVLAVIVLLVGLFLWKFRVEIRKRK